MGRGARDGLGKMSETGGGRYIRCSLVPLLGRRRLSVVQTAGTCAVTATAVPSLAELVSLFWVTLSQRFGTVLHRHRSSHKGILRVLGRNRDFACVLHALLIKNGIHHVCIPNKLCCHTCIPLTRLLDGAMNGQ